MSTAAAKARLDPQPGEELSGFVSGSDIKLAFDDLEGEWQAADAVVQAAATAAQNTANAAQATANAALNASGSKLVVVPDVGSIPPGTAAGTVIVVSPTVGGNAPPSASFTTSISDLAVTVNGSGSADADGTIVSYAWNFGDGATATGATPSAHTYAAGGTYSITLTVMDNQGATGSTTRSVTVSPAGTVTSPTLASLGTWLYGAANLTSLNVDMPNDIQNGDYLVAFVHSQNSSWTSDVTPPSGWSRIGPAFATPDSSRRYNAYFAKRITNAAGEPASVTFTLPSSGHRAVAVIGAFRVVHSTPVAAAPDFTWQNGGSVASISTPSATAPANSLAVAFFSMTTAAGNVGTVNTPPSGWTPRVNAYGPDATGASAANWLHLYTKAISASASTSAAAAFNGPALASTATGLLILAGA